MAAQEGSKLRASDVADKYRETIELMEELEEQKANFPRSQEVYRG